MLATTGPNAHYLHCAGGLGLGPALSLSEPQDRLPLGLLTFCDQRQAVPGRTGIRRHSSSSEFHVLILESVCVCARERSVCMCV